MNKKYQDFNYKLINPKASRELIIVEIDDYSLKNLGYPLDRRYFVDFIDNLTKSGVPIIAFDLIFGEKSNDELSDIEFSNILKKSNNIIFGLSITDKNFLLQTYDLFKDKIINSGYLRPKVDNKTNVVYSIIPLSIFGLGEEKENFSISVLKSYYSYIYSKNYSDIYGYYDNKYILTPNIEIPLSRLEKNDFRIGNNNENEILINYTNRDNFQKVSFYDVYNSDNFEKLKQNINFEDKIILVGFSAKGIKDVFNTPNGIEYGVYIHANTLNTILTKSFLIYFNKNYEWILIALLIIVSIYFNLSRSGFVLLLSNLLIILIFIIFFPFGVILFTNLIINYPSELIFSLIISLIVANFLKYILENKDKLKLNKALGEYVSKDIAHEILSGEGKINLDGEQKKISIFFSDIEGFTSISEILSPEELVGFLRIYLSKMSDIIIEEDGFINKYEGDSIMALWGVFGNENNIVKKACITAIKQQKLLRQLNLEWSKVFKKKINIRIGINFGEAIIGNIGSKGKKIEFTAMGDSINLASRLEGINKYFNTNICVSENVYLEVKSNFLFRYLGKIKVKGKNIGVKIYELIEEIDKANIKQKDIVSKFEEAINYYETKDFDKALELFNNLKLNNDKPSVFYIDRCLEYIKKAPAKNWNGVWVFKDK